MSSKFNLSQFPSLDDEDDDFQIPLSQTPKHTLSSRIKPAYNPRRPSKKPKKHNNPGKENIDPNSLLPHQKAESSADDFILDANCSLDFIESSIDCSVSSKVGNEKLDSESGIKEKLEVSGGYLCNSIEARLMKSRVDYCGVNVGNEEDFEENSELDVLIKLCAEEEESEVREENKVNCDGNEFRFVLCPLCGTDISDLSEEFRLVHTNACLDKEENSVVLGGGDGRPAVVPRGLEGPVCSPKKVVVSPVVKWLRNLGLERYEEDFVREEIDWETLQCLTEEDLFGIGVTALGPRKKIVHALSELRKGSYRAVEVHGDAHASGEVGSRGSHGAEMQVEASKIIGDDTSKLTANKLITDYFPGSDAFKYLRGDCSHWFLTHFHMDHYQGLTRSFCHGRIYCSLITAKLVNLKIGIPWDSLHVLPLNQKICIDGVDVTCLDANHCPGSIIILFEPPNGKAVLHTGDFRFSEKMVAMPVLQMSSIHTLILDTTYCNAQYDFPKQEAVIQFVIEAIQAEAFNPKTLFLIGSYTIGKERLFLEVARVLHKKVYVNMAKFRLLECLGFPEEDMRWITLNEQESHIHVVPMWTLASFKRLKHISSQYAGRFTLIVAFSPTGWTCGKGKKKSPGRRCQQGTIIRYEVPYSEHCSFTELREFVKFVSPEKIIPSVNNDGPDSANDMVSLLLS
ncbi:DNA CROSS-LINK REPAIR PROTEIN PSO2/SNM1-RELATED [Salix koriyanagi]|uniref:DNA CROSS-LINK REPAIR PROTEIN PSO2/SNM1-RELATED n=1 Tax=Salix koriyanagi TaxID=2511006 RepID=A0A9Q0ZT39_9ROSI|nr:DNA CROSS-LINK REPAIR PROTEIN PSO2/SNM1-RELATED [Salix koriyanagi]